jgi:cytochrome c553
MKTIVRTLMIANIALAMATANAQSLSEDDRSLLFPSNADITEGEILATEACGACHSLDGISVDPSLPHLAGQHVVYLYEELKAYKEGIREDESMRKAVQFLSDDAFRKVSIYYASLVPPGPPAKDETPGESDDQAKETVDDPVALGKAAATACAACHGADGNSQIPGMPNLTAQSPEYFVSAMKAYQGSGRPGTMMNAMASALNDETLRNMGLFYALQEPRQTANAGGGDADAGEESAAACASCHGADGNTIAADMPTLAGQDATYLTAALQAYKTGQREHEQMVTATADLGDDVIGALAAYYAGKEPIAREVRKPPTLAEWVTRCDRCHGIGGNSTNPRYPALASQNEPYLARVIENYASGGRHNTTMSAMSQPLRPADIEALAAYYASQPRKAILYVELPCADANE